MKHKPATIGIHGRNDQSYHSAIFPIYQTSTFGFEHNADIAGVISGETPDAYIYSRLGNPTVRNVEERLALLEGAEDALLFSSGMAAIMTTILAHVSAGDTLVASRPIYGGTYKLIADVLPRYGIKTLFLEAEDLYMLERHAPEAKLVFFETPANPTCTLIDIAAVVKAAQKVGALTVIDNTFASPINQHPIELGVDMVVHSATKYLGGHSDLIAGAVMTSYALMTPIREHLIVFGGCMSPLEAFLLDRSLKTLRARVELHNYNAMQLAMFFSDEDKIEKVYYPGLPNTSDYEIANKQMTGFGGMLALQMQSAEAAETFVDHLTLALNAVSLGGVETLVTIPALSTHATVDAEELRIARVTPATVRISAGLEDIDDLLGDFKASLVAVR